MTPDALVALQSISVSLGSREILSQIRYSITPGKRVLLLGDSGSGKTTLLRCIAGLQPISSGRIVYSPALRPLGAIAVMGVGFVMQDLGLFPHLTAAENVALPLYLTGRMTFANANALASEILTRIGLEGREQSRPPNLSGGQNQRLAIARTLAARPRLLLLDEFSSGIDSSTLARVLKLITEFTDPETAIVAATHDSRVFGPFWNNVISIRNGSLEHSGLPDGQTTTTTKSSEH